MQKAPLRSVDVNIWSLPYKPFLIKWASSTVGVIFASPYLTLTLTCIPDLAYTSLVAHSYFKCIFAQHFLFLQESCAGYAKCHLGHVCHGSYFASRVSVVMLNFMFRGLIAVTWRCQVHYSNTFLLLTAVGPTRKWITGHRILQYFLNPWRQTFPHHGQSER